MLVFVEIEGNGGLLYFMHRLPENEGDFKSSKTNFLFLSITICRWQEFSKPGQNVWPSSGCISC